MNSPGSFHKTRSGFFTFSWPPAIRNVTSRAKWGPTSRRICAWSSFLSPLLLSLVLSLSLSLYLPARHFFLRCRCGMPERSRPSIDFSVLAISTRRCGEKRRLSDVVGARIDCYAGERKTERARERLVIVHYFR